MKTHSKAPAYKAALGRQEIDDFEEVQISQTRDKVNISELICHVLQVID